MVCGSAGSTIVRTSWRSHCGPFSLCTTVAAKTHSDVLSRCPGQIIVTKAYSTTFYLPHISSPALSIPSHPVVPTPSIAPRQLMWSSYSTAPEIIPASALFYTTPISGSPYDISVVPGAAAYPYSDAFGEGVGQATAGVPASFVIQAKASRSIYCLTVYGRVVGAVACYVSKLFGRYSFVVESRRKLRNAAYL